MLCLFSLFLFAQDEMRQLVRILVKVMPNSSHLVASKEDEEHPSGTTEPAASVQVKENKEGYSSKVC